MRQHWRFLIGVTAIVLPVPVVVVVIPAPMVVPVLGIVVLDGGIGEFMLDGARRTNAAKGVNVTRVQT